MSGTAIMMMADDAAVEYSGRELQRIKAKLQYERHTSRILAKQLKEEKEATAIIAKDNAVKLIAASLGISKKEVLDVVYRAKGHV